MGWKEWPNWLRYGLKYMFFAFLYILVTILFAVISDPLNLDKIIPLFVYLIIFFYVALCVPFFLPSCSPDEGFCGLGAIGSLIFCFIIGPIILLIIAFIIGAIVGLNKPSNKGVRSLHE